MEKPKVKVILAGGTICQKKGVDGILRPSDENYLSRVEKLDSLADISIETLRAIDSTNMETRDRKEFVRIIKDSHKEFDGFVIVQGTDSMADSACAINYMIQNLGKPIVFTGSQISIYEPGTDARINVYNAVKTSTTNLGETVISFGQKIIRGSRAIKEDERGINAFASPKAPLIGRIGAGIDFSEGYIKRHGGNPVFFTDFEEGVEFFQQTSGSKNNLLEKIIEEEEVKGIVLGGFGAGNVMDKYIPSIEKATQMGKPIVVITSCHKGFADMEIYEVGSNALKAGAIGGYDLTRESASQKLMYALGKANQTDFKGRDKVEFVRGIIKKEIGKDINLNPTI